MKLSEMNTEQGLDLLCEITPFVAEISADEELLAEIKRKIKIDDKNSRAEILMAGAEKMNKIVPILLKKKRDCVLGILAAVNNKTTDEISKQSFLTTAKQIKDLLSDKEFLSFFK